MILSFEPFHGKHIKTFPLHHSQQILADTADELRISLQVLITYDIKMELRMYGDFVRIIQPAGLLSD